MTDLLAEVFPTIEDNELSIFVRFIRGKMFPDWSSEKLNFGPALLYEALHDVIGQKRDFVISAINNSGDVGEVTEELLQTYTEPRGRRLSQQKERTACRKA